VGGVTTDAVAVSWDVRDLGVTEVNARLRALPDGGHARLTQTRGVHNLAVGLSSRIRVTVEGNAGYYLAGLCAGPDVEVHGSVGPGLAENLMSGTVRVHGSCSVSAAASAHGGLVVVEGNASSRAGISLKGGALAVAGDVGHMAAFMAQAGTVLVGGDAGDSLGDSLYEAVVYVGGRIRSLGSDARIEDMTDADVEQVRRLCTAAGFEHIDPENVTRVASARELYAFDALKDQRY
jgi:methylamine---glutamate N-methyltransferase subunit B